MQCSADVPGAWFRCGFTQINSPELIRAHPGRVVAAPPSSPGLARTRPEELRASPAGQHRSRSELLRLILPAQGRDHGSTLSISRGFVEDEM